MAKEYAKAFYNSTLWRDTANAYMESVNHICERCGQPAKIVHHRRYITPATIHDPNITLDWSNLEALCQDCHNNEHSSKSATANGLMFSSGGQLIRK